MQTHRPCSLRIIRQKKEVNRELTLRSLKQYGLSNNIVICKDGDQALRAILRRDEFSERSDIGLVLLDLNLPTIIGCDLLALIRANPETRRVPVIVLTSSDDEPDIQEARKLGADHYMVKPIEFAKVVQVAKTLRSRGVVMRLRARKCHEE